MNVPAPIVYYYPSKLIYMVLYIPIFYKYSKNRPTVSPNISGQRGGLYSKSPHLLYARHGAAGPRTHTSIETPLGLCL